MAAWRVARRAWCSASPDLSTSLAPKPCMAAQCRSLPSSMRWRCCRTFTWANQAGPVIRPKGLRVISSVAVRIGASSPVNETVFNIILIFVFILIGGVFAAAELALVSLHLARSSGSSTAEGGGSWWPGCTRVGQNWARMGSLGGLVEWPTRR